MAEGGPPILPSTGIDPALTALKILELGQVEVHRVSAELKILAETVRLEAQVIRINDNGTVTLRTAQGAEIDVKPPVQLQTGQVVQIRLEGGNPPRVARLSLPPQSTLPPVIQADGAPAPVISENTAPAQTRPNTVVSPQVTQRYDLPPIPLGSTVPAQFISLPIPPSQTGVEVLLTTLFNTGSLTTATLAPQQNPLSSLAQIAQATLPPPILEGIKNVQLLKIILVGRQFSPETLQSTLSGLRGTTQTLPVSGLPLTQPAPAISPLTILPVSTGQPPVINTEKPIQGIGTIVSSLINGANGKNIQIQSQASTARILFTQAPGNLLQVPSFPITITQTAGQPSSLFFGVTLGQTSGGDFAVLGTNGIAIIPKHVVTGALLPGTVLIAQGQGITARPDINLFNIPVINVESGFLNFNPIFGDQWPVLDEMLNVLAQIDPAYALSVRSSIPSMSNPAQLSTSILFFIAATGIGDVRAWIGDKAFDLLAQAGRTELSTLFNNDFATITNRAAEQTPDGWRPFMVPMFFGEELHRMQFFTRHHFEEGEGGQAGTKKTRFLVNVNKTSLGPIQLDGLVNEQRLDMILRSDDILTQEMRQGIRQHYSNALKESGLAGAISFEHGNNQWVEVDTTPAIDQSVFI